MTNPTVVVEPCVCGGEIVATRRTEADIMAAVQAHQTTDEHIAWRESQRDLG